MNNTTKSIIASVVAGFIVLISLLSLTLVDAGEVGVVKKWGRVTGRVLEPGAHFVMPFADNVLRYDTKKVIYETRRTPEEKDSDGVTTDYAVDTNTKDGQQVNVFFTVRFSVDPTQANWVAQNIGSQEALLDKVIRPEARIWARNVPREFEATDLYSGNVVEVQNKIADALRPVYATNGVLLDSVGIREIEFEGQYVKAIEAKQIEYVNIETNKNKAEAAKYEKEERITQAEASAEEQRLQQATLGTEVLEKLMIDKWDGHYPRTLITGDSGQFILPLPNE